MILSVTMRKTTYNHLPYKFEAGTAKIAGVIGLGAAIDYIRGIGLDQICDYEETLRKYATDSLIAIPGVRLYGTAPQKSAILSFLVDDIHPHDIGSVLNSHGIAIRAGHHCTQPLMSHYGIAATARATFSIYSSHEEIDRLSQGVKSVKELLS